MPVTSATMLEISSEAAVLDQRRQQPLVDLLDALADGPVAVDQHADDRLFDVGQRAFGRDAQDGRAGGFGLGAAPRRRRLGGRRRRRPRPGPCRGSCARPRAGRPPAAAPRPTASRSRPARCGPDWPAARAATEPTSRRCSRPAAPATTSVAGGSARRKTSDTVTKGIVYSVPCSGPCFVHIIQGSHAGPLGV